jgi:predicted dehydrogenase
MNNQKQTRRDILKAGCAAAAGIAAPYFIPSSVLGNPNTPPPSEQVIVGVIGMGTRGRMHLQQTQLGHGIRSVAVADCYKDRREVAAAAIQGKAYADFREILDRDDIDAVIIATPDHWHVPIALMAARAGKDAYVEKPLGLTLQQDVLCQKEFHAHKRIFQYGTQQREAQHQQFGRELVRSGKLGTLKAIEVKAPNGGSGGLTAEAPIPPDFDYEMWLGPAPAVPYTVDRCKPQGTYWIYDQSIGYLGGWGAHPLDILVWCYDGDQSGPYTVEGSGVVPTEGLYDTVYDWNMALQMADGVKITFVPGSDSTKFIGTEGRLELTRQSIRAFPQELLPGDFPANNHTQNSSRHLENFADAIRTRQETSSPMNDAVRSDVMSHLCDIAIRTGEQITWDPVKQEIIGGSDKAKAMASRPVRAPWTL